MTQYSFTPPVKSNPIVVQTARVSAEQLVNDLVQEIGDLKRELSAKEEALDNAEKEIADAQQEIEKLKEEVRSLKAGMAKNSSNSSKPSSTDGFKKPKPKNRRQKTGKKPGGQKGNKGYTLKQVSNPDKIICHNPNECPHCKANLEHIEGHCTEKRQVFDIPPIKLYVEEHQLMEKVCTCGQSCKGVFPKDVKAHVQYGYRVQALTSYLFNQQLIPVERLTQLLRDIFSISISPGTCANINARLFTKLESFENNLKLSLIARKILHVDESGARCEGKLHWLHTASTIEATFYAIHAKRGQEAMDAIGILTEFKGTAVHDYWKPYYTYTHMNHSLCNGHLDRELIFLIEEEKEPWAKEMQAFLYKGKALVEKAQEQGNLSTEQLEQLNKEYHEIVAKGLAYHETLKPLPKGSRGKQKQRTGKNLLDRLKEKKDDILRFINNFLVPFTNNLAEQAIRMMKVKLKISGCFRTLAGAEQFCRIRSYLDTTRKQGCNIWEALIDAFAGTPKEPKFSNTC